MENRHPTGKPTALQATEANEKVFGTVAMRAVLAWVTYKISVSTKGILMSAKDTVPVERQFHARPQQTARLESSTCSG